MARRWNHNIHHHGAITRHLPARRVLDVCCGVGELTRDLAARAVEVLGIALDAASLEVARADTTAANVDYIHADVMTADLGDPFDLVASVATLHHLDLAVGLARLRDLTAPGGTLVVVGLARATTPVDWAYDGVGQVVTRWHRRRHGYWEHPSPIVWPPAASHRQVRAVARRVLPDVEYRRTVLFRHVLTWTRPG